MGEHLKAKNNRIKLLEKRAFELKVQHDNVTKYGCISNLQIRGIEEN